MDGRIKKLRKAFDLTQQEFADRIGSKRNTIAKYETGVNVPSTAVIALICREFNVSETWLRTGEGEMFLETPDTAMGQLAKELGLDEFMQGVVSEYLKLNEEQRKVVREFVNKIAEQPIKSSTVPTLAPPHTPTMEEEARAEAEKHAQRVYAQILAEKKAQAAALSGFSVPQAGDGSEKKQA